MATHFLSRARDRSGRCNGGSGICNAFHAFRHGFAVPTAHGAAGAAANVAGTEAPSALLEHRDPLATAHVGKSLVRRMLRSRWPAALRTLLASDPGWRTGDAVCTNFIQGSNCAWLIAADSSSPSTLKKGDPVAAAHARHGLVRKGSPRLRPRRRRLSGRASRPRGPSRCLRCRGWLGHSRAAARPRRAARARIGSTRAAAHPRRAAWAGDLGGP
mmetsp:Transcript_136163/g.435589  ORF Transcript_136163/g.435589 Transcript_136163/m.435589 type:complete len:215 (-) Transcript_136163:877-1521(-)